MGVVSVARKDNLVSITLHTQTNGYCCHTYTIVHTSTQHSHTHAGTHTHARIHAGTYTHTPHPPPALTGWWMVDNRGSIGWAPASFLVPVDAEDLRTEAQENEQLIEPEKGRQRAQEKRLTKSSSNIEPEYQGCKVSNDSLE